MASFRRFREREGTRKFSRSDLPQAEPPSQRFVLKGNLTDRWVRRVAVLPGSGYIATSSDDGHLRVFDARGDGHPLVVIAAHKKRVYGLAALDVHVLASGSFRDSKLHTWDTRTGARIHTIDVGKEGVGAIGGVGPETLVAGLGSGGLVFIRHSRGHQLAAVARHEDAHSE